MVDQTTPTPVNPKGQKKWLLWSLIGFTGILLTTAVVLFFQINKPAPTPLPSPRPKASPTLPQVQQTTTENACQLSFTVAASPSPSPTPTPTPTPSPIACFDTCDSSADCNTGLECQTVGGTKRCVNETCPEDADCSCAGASPSPSPSVSPTPISGASPSPSTIARVEQPTLPQAGVSTPAVLGVSAGILLMLLGLLF